MAYTKCHAKIFVWSIELKSHTRAATMKMASNGVHNVRFL